MIAEDGKEAPEIDSNSFAWGVIDLSDTSFAQVEPEVGRFSVWARRYNETTGFAFEELPWHSCSMVELGLEKGSSNSLE